MQMKQPCDWLEFICKIPTVQVDIIIPRSLFLLNQLNPIIRLSHHQSTCTIESSPELQSGFLLLFVVKNELRPCALTILPCLINVVIFSSTLSSLSGGSGGNLILKVTSTWPGPIRIHKWINAYQELDVWTIFPRWNAGSVSITSLSFTPWNQILHVSSLWTFNNV